jgi:hypothetical protein
MRPTILIALFFTLSLLTSCQPTLLEITHHTDIRDVCKSIYNIQIGSEIIYHSNVGIFQNKGLTKTKIQGITEHLEDGLKIEESRFINQYNESISTIIISPGGNGPYPGILLQPDLPYNSLTLLKIGKTYASLGAVVMIVRSPFSIQEGNIYSLTEQDRVRQIKYVVSLRNALDMLSNRLDTNPNRLAFIGYGNGGTVGGMLAGIDHRLNLIILVNGNTGPVTQYTLMDLNNNPIESLTLFQREKWITAMWPLEPVHYIGKSAPGYLYFQNGTQYKLSPVLNTMCYFEAGSFPKSIQWYEAGNKLPPQAMFDQALILEKYIGTQNPTDLAQNLIFLNPTKSLYLLVPIILNKAILVDRLLLFWYLAIIGSLSYLISDLWRRFPLPWDYLIVWLLTILIIGPFGMLIYKITLKGDIGKTTNQNAYILIISLSISTWCVAACMTGTVISFWTFLELEGLFGLPLHKIISVILFSFASWLLIFRLIITKSIKFFYLYLPNTYPIRVGILSIGVCIIIGYPTIQYLIDHWIIQWYPFGYDISNPILWMSFSIISLVCIIVTFVLTGFVGLKNNIL